MLTDRGGLGVRFGVNRPHLMAVAVIEWHGKHRASGAVVTFRARIGAVVVRDVHGLIAANASNLLEKAAKAVLICHLMAHLDQGI